MSKQLNTSDQTRGRIHTFGPLCNGGAEAPTGLLPPIRLLHEDREVCGKAIDGAPVRENVSDSSCVIHSTGDGGRLLTALIQAAGYNPDNVHLWSRENSKIKSYGCNSRGTKCARINSFAILSALYNITHPANHKECWF